MSSEQAQPIDDESKKTEVSQTDVKTGVSQTDVNSRWKTISTDTEGPWKIRVEERTRIKDNVPETLTLHTYTTGKHHHDRTYEIGMSSVNTGQLHILTKEQSTLRISVRSKGYSLPNSDNLPAIISPNHFSVFAKEFTKVFKDNHIYKYVLTPTRPTVSKVSTRSESDQELGSFMRLKHYAPASMLRMLTQKEEDMRSKHGGKGRYVCTSVTCYLERMQSFDYEPGVSCEYAKEGYTSWQWWKEVENPLPRVAWTLTFDSEVVDPWIEEEKTEDDDKVGEATQEYADTLPLLEMSEE